jgi:dihydropteroate synthase
VPRHRRSIPSARRAPRADCGYNHRVPDLAPIRFRHLTLDWARPYLVGVVNVTPDSFSDGGALATVDAAVAHALRLEADGADLVDVGGESTRPGAAPVSVQAELDRVIPVIERLAARTGAVLSIDTCKAEVARAALAAGAEVVNDVSGGRFDPGTGRAAAEAGAAFVCGHLRGASLAEVHAGEADPPGFDEVAVELAARIRDLPPALAGRVVCDPGLGFGKRTPENLELLRRAGELAGRLSCAVMVGPSRKRFLGQLTGRPVAERDPATIGASLAAVVSGAHLIRVHDVAGVHDALEVFREVVR